MLKISRLDETKINQLLDELNEDRNNIFNALKSSKTYDKLNEDKMKGLENIQRCLMTYKKILTKEKEHK